MKGVEGKYYATKQAEGGAAFDSANGEIQTGRIDCMRPDDCGSGYACVNGSCVQADFPNPNQEIIIGSFPAPPTAGALCPNGPTLDDEIITDCFSLGCDEGPKCGDITLPDSTPDDFREDNPDKLNCCGGEKYQCPDEAGNMGWQCFPCWLEDIEFPEIDNPTFPEIPGVSVGTGTGGIRSGGTGTTRPDDDDDTDPNNPYPRWCSAHADAVTNEFGGQGIGSCNSSCSFCNSEGRCEQFSSSDSNTPCYCKPGGSQCTDFCSKCQNDGSCLQLDPLACGNQCLCEVPCPGSQQTLRRHHVQPYQGEASGPRTACWQDCEARAKADIPRLCPPVNEDPCTSNGGNDCLQDCQCVTLNTPCGEEEPPCPDGMQCESQGNMYASPGGVCNNAFGGGITWFRKQCLALEPGTPVPNGEGGMVGCGTCEVNEDCQDCQSCVNGLCEDAVLADGETEACQVECQGGECDASCCEGECLPGCKYEILENCHASPYEIVGPCSGLELVFQDEITTEEAVCSRYHTHCNIMGEGTYLGLHLDCQASYRKIGEGGFWCKR